MPILCKIHRGDFIESIHVAYAVVVNEKGEIVYSTGDPHYLTCVRSALKPVSYTHLTLPTTPYV